MRPDRTLAATRDYISRTIGPEFLPRSIVSFDEIFSRTVANKPILMYAVGDESPIQRIVNAAGTYQGAHIISIGHVTTEVCIRY